MNPKDFNLLPFLNSGMTLNPKKLPLKVSEILTNYLYPKCYDVPLETLLIDLNAKISQVLAFNRVKIESTLVETKDMQTFPNFYGIIFLPSGEGKDKPIRIINKNLMPEIFEDVKKRIEMWLSKYIDELNTKAEELYPNSKARRDEWKADNKPHRPIFTIKNGSVEGLESMRKAFMTCAFGGTFFQHSEFADYITATSRESIDFLSLINEIYDFGDSSPKVIKSDKNIVAVDGVPSNMLVHSSVSGLLDGQGRGRLMEFLNRGSARRSFMAYPELAPIGDMTVDKMFERILQRKSVKQEAESKTEAYANLFSEVYNATHSGKFQPMVFRFDQDADLLLEVYQEYNKYRAAKVNLFSEEGLRSEMKNRHWKALKLAGLIAVFEHPTSYKVTKEDVEYAIYQTETFGNHLKRFFDNKQMTESQKIYNLLVEHPGEWTRKSALQQSLKIPRNDFAQIFKEAEEELRTMCEANGYKFEFQQPFKNVQEYRVI